MQCSITGRITSQPVLSPATHLIYDRTQLLLALDRDQNKCPITGIVIDREQLIPVKVSSSVVPPRTSEVTSVPQMLKLLETEWDAVALETFKLRNALEQQRKETSMALYELDAAKIVIQRLYGEIQELKSNNKSTSQQHHAQPPPPPHPTITMLPQNDIQIITNKSQELVSMRKKRKTVSSSSTTSTLNPYKSIFELPNSHKNNTQATCMDIRNDVIAIGYSNGTINIWINRKFIRELTIPTAASANSSSTSTNRNNNNKPLAIRIVLDSDFKHLGLLVTCERSFHVWWRVNADMVVQSIVLANSSPIQHVRLHPTNEHVMVCQNNGTWNLINLPQGRIILTRERISSPSTTSSSSTSTSSSMVGFDLHPDGLLVAVSGSKPNTIEVWNLVENNANPIIMLTSQVGGMIDSISFCENGISLVCGSSQLSKCDVFDLRKPDSIARSFDHIQFNPSLIRVERNGTLLSFIQFSEQQNRGSIQFMNASSKNIEEWTLFGESNTLMEDNQHIVDVVFENGQCLVVSDYGQVVKIDLVGGNSNSNSNSNDGTITTNSTDNNSTTTSNNNESKKKRGRQ
jgi:pre-mRNA-processing factor 19